MTRAFSSIDKSRLDRSPQHVCPKHVRGFRLRRDFSRLYERQHRMYLGPS